MKKLLGLVMAFTVIGLMIIPISAYSFTFTGSGTGNFTQDCNLAKDVNYSSTFNLISNVNISTDSNQKLVMTQHSILTSLFPSSISHCVVQYTSAPLFVSAYIKLEQDHHTCIFTVTSNFATSQCDNYFDDMVGYPITISGNVSYKIDGVFGETLTYPIHARIS